MSYAPDWFTASRVRRIQRLIELLPSASSGIGRHTLMLDLRGSLDGLREDHPDILAVLIALGLVHEQGSRIRLSRKGRRAQSLSPPNARRELAEVLLSSGYLHSQVRLAIEACTVDGNGSAHVPLATLRRSAPQLLGLLRSWPEVVGPSTVVMPKSLYANLDTPWSLVPLAQPGDGTKKAVGSRGEAYSYHLLRQRAKRPTAISWVARDDDGLGYDIEDRTTGFARIEVKSSQQGEVRFFLTENEHSVAHSDPDSYIVHFWGYINLHQDPNTEFRDLRKRGFPKVFQNIAQHLADGRLQAVATRFRVTATVEST